MALSVISLLCLVGAIVFGFVRKTNVGLVSLGLALVLGDPSSYAARNRNRENVQLQDRMRRVP